ncbi:hypothetical protein AcV5_003475 [Taiwanofungus camphoratus]|nr:hypothetical protein AcV5_003475 [Antrodia cinnamomea]KAI0935001.1 hypothetical protein AcV7_003919 [Antrodia cinnamomea]
MPTRCERYGYQEHMPFARQPFKAIYVAQRIITTLLMVPFWILYYAILPRRYRPRKSWSLKQIVAVNFTRRIYKVAELAGVTWGTRNPNEPCDNRKLKETRFEWIDPLPENLRTGIVVDKQVEFKKVGVFIWPKECPADGLDINSSSSEAVLTNQPDVETSAGGIPLIGIFLHGGGYCHMSAHESSGTSKIPRQLMEDKAFTKIYAVEYRLLQHAPFPAAVQDAAAVYASIVRHHQRRLVNSTPSSNRSEHPDNTGGGSSNKGSGSTSCLTVHYSMETANNRRENDEVQQRIEKAARGTHCKIILIGDSAGGNLVLGLARWIRDEGVLPPPDGLLLLSPSCDPSHAFPEKPSLYIPRPHEETDYLVDTPEPRALLQRTFLGHNPLETMHSPYVSPASQRVLCAFYGDAFAESVRDLKIRHLDASARANLRTMASEPVTPVLSMPILGSPGSVGVERIPTSLAHPIMTSPRGLSLFSEFPKACVVLGDAERLEREVMKLVGAMERDRVSVRTVWVEDGVHDVLMMGWWDERVRAKVWQEIEDWIREV